MSVDNELLKKHAAAFQFTRETSTAFHECLFTLHPEVASHWDAEDIDPEKLCKSQKFMMMGMDEMRQLIGLANQHGHSSWKALLSSFCEYYAEQNVPLADEKMWTAICDGLCGALKKHAGGCDAKQTAAWQALFKVAYADAKAGKYC